MSVLTMTPKRTGAAVPEASLLQIRGVPATRLRALLAASWEEACRPPGPFGDELSGSVLATLFFEASTRTRLSFAIAAHRLGAQVVDLGPTSSAGKGESIPDTARTIEAMGVRALIIRTSQAGASHLVARSVSCSVINAGDGRHEHPTQGLLDALTIAEAHGRTDGFDLGGLSVGIVGDVLNSRVARSNIACLAALGARVVCVGPPTLAPALLASLGCEVSNSLDEVLGGLDVVMMLRVQFERHAGGPSAFGSIGAYRARFALTSERAKGLRHDAVVMHPGPMNRGIELDGDVADSVRARVTRQVALGVAVRTAVIRACVLGKV